MLLLLKDVPDNAVMVGIPAKNVGTASEKFTPYGIDPSGIQKKIMKTLQNNFVDGVGNTRLYSIKNLQKLTGCNVYGKAEYLNPGGFCKR